MPSVAQVRPNISGADYPVIDTGDGYHIVRHVPIFSEIDKGEHGAPYAVTKEVLGRFYGTMRDWFSKGFKATLSIGHNDNFGLTHPNFAGYFVPTGLAPYEFPDGSEKWTIFADFKMKDDWYAKFANAELPYHSPEIYPKTWEEYRIDIVSFLDTKPPFFKFAINTIGAVTVDHAARFEASDLGGLDVTIEDFKKELLAGSIKLTKDEFAAFAAKMEAEADAGGAPAGDGDEGGFDDGFAKLYPKTAKRLLKFMGKTGSTGPNAAPLLGPGAMESASAMSAAAKPNPMPANPGQAVGSAMALPADLAVKFALQDKDIAELKEKLAAQENEKKAAALVVKADEVLATKIVPPQVKKHVIAWASQYAAAEGGEKVFMGMIDDLKSGMTTKPTVSFALPRVESTDPAVAKFAAGESPDAVARITQFAAEWLELKAHARGFSCSQDDYIKNELSLWKADPTGFRGSQARR